MPEDPKPMFDVAPPGQAPASASSRPIIVSNAARVQDPMMTNSPQSPSTSSLLADTPNAPTPSAIGDVVAPAASTPPVPPAEAPAAAVHTSAQPGAFAVHVHHGHGVLSKAVLLWISICVVAAAAFGLMWLLVH